MPRSTASRSTTNSSWATSRLMILAGIDTTWSAIGSGLWHFAQHPEEVERLVATPDDDPLWVTAMEEVLRYYAPVTMGRQVIKDTEVSGCPDPSGRADARHLPGRQPRPRGVRGRPRVPARSGCEPPRRVRARHPPLPRVRTSPGSRCSSRSRSGCRAFPNFALDPERETTWANGQVRGPRNIPVLLNR